MKINSITVGGFKNLNTTKLELDNICAIISPNNYGKSNLLEAIDFGFDFIHESRKGRKSMMGWVRGIPLCLALENSEYRFEIEFEDVQKITHCSTGCGGCHDKIMAIISDLMSS